MDILAVRPPPHHLPYKEEEPDIDSPSLQSLSETGEDVPRSPAVTPRYLITGRRLSVNSLAPEPATLCPEDERQVYTTPQMKTPIFPPIKIMQAP